MCAEAGGAEGQTSVVGDVRGLGLFWAVDLVKDQKTKEPFNTTRQGRGQAAAGGPDCGEDGRDGVMIQAWVSHFVIAPPLIVTRQQLEEGIAALDRHLSIADEQCAR